MGWFRSSTSPDDGRAPTLEQRLLAVGPGVPGHCPACDGLGYIDDLDLGQRYQIQHCKGCGHRWEYLFDRDGRVVGLTELDADGQPVARMRVRNRTLAEEVAAVPVAEATATPRLPTADDGPDRVIDLRDGATPGPADSEDDDGRAPDQMSPAEWLRHAVRR